MKSIKMKNITNTFTLGDVVEPIDGFTLRSGCSSYELAIVVSVSPFVLVSKYADMKWSAIKPEEFVRIGVAHHDVLRKCMKRL
jgi:hypothetical protein